MIRKARAYRIDVFSWVGIIPLFACEVVDARLLAGRDRFNALLWKHKGGMFDGSVDMRLSRNHERTGGTFIVRWSPPPCW